MQVGHFPYQQDNIQYEGFVAYPQHKSAKMPAVLVAHAWDGRNIFACEKAEYLASLGYVGFALDMYGNGVVADTTEQKMALMSPLMEDRVLLRRRVLAAFETVKQLEGVDPDRIAIMGFCFGGLCALDLARSGAKIKAAISFHGLLKPPVSLKNERMQAKILALHGHDDPMVPPADVLAFQTEMTEAQVDWQMHVFGNTVHAFTNPVAHSPEMGLVYSELAAKRSWQLLENFLAEIF